MYCFGVVNTLTLWFSGVLSMTHRRAFEQKTDCSQATLVYSNYGNTMKIKHFLTAIPKSVYHQHSGVFSKSSFLYTS